MKWSLFKDLSALRLTHQHIKRYSTRRRYHRNLTHMYKTCVSSTYALRCTHTHTNIHSTPDYSPKRVCPMRNNACICHCRDQRHITRPLIGQTTRCVADWSAMNTCDVITSSPLFLVYCKYFHARVTTRLI